MYSIEKLGFSVIANSLNACQTASYQMNILMSEYLLTKKYFSVLIKLLGRNLTGSCLTSVAGVFFRYLPRSNEIRELILQGGSFKKSRRTESIFILFQNSF